MSRLRRGSSTPAALEIVEDQRAGLFIETSSGNKIQSVEGIMPRHAQPPTEQPAADWERPFGAFLLMLGVSALVFAVIPRAWSNGALLNQLNLVRWPLLVPAGLLAASLAVTGLWLGSNHRVRRLANSAAGIPGRVGTTRAGPVLLVVLGLSVALGAATWDLLLDARAPWAAPLVLAMSLLGSWLLALGALALNRTGEVSTTRGTYLLVVMTFAILVLGEWSHRDTLQQLPCGAGAGVPLHEVIGPGSRRICFNARSSQPNSGGRPSWVTPLRQTPLPPRYSGPTVAVDVANVRSAPSTAANVIITLPYGTQLHIVGQSADWYEIRLSDGREGWVAAGWLVNSP